MQPKLLEPPILLSHLRRPRRPARDAGQQRLRTVAPGDDCTNVTGTDNCDAFAGVHLPWHFDHINNYYASIPSGESGGTNKCKVSTMYVGQPRSSDEKCCDTKVEDLCNPGEGGSIWDRGDDSGDATTCGSTYNSFTNWENSFKNSCRSEDFSLPNIFECKLLSTNENTKTFGTDETDQRVGCFVDEQCHGPRNLKSAPFGTANDGGDIPLHHIFAGSEPGSAPGSAITSVFANSELSDRDNFDGHGFVAEDPFEREKLSNMKTKDPEIVFSKFSFSDETTTSKNETNITIEHLNDRYFINKIDPGESSWSDICFN